jgi:hypothetical protein
MLENRWGFDENSLVQEGRRQEAGGRRQKERKLIQSAFSPLSTG